MIELGIGLLLAFCVLIYVFYTLTIKNNAISLHHWSLKQKGFIINSCKHGYFRHKKYDVLIHSLNNTILYNSYKNGWVTFASKNDYDANVLVDQIIQYYQREIKERKGKCFCNECVGRKKYDDLYIVELIKE